MKKILFLTVILGVVLMIFTVIGFSVNSQERNMQKLNLQTKIGDGKDKEVTPLFDGERRKIVQITLRNKAVLDAHKAAEPITIQCIAGEGKLIVGQEKEEVDLQKGVLVTIEPNVVHEIRATPKVSILLTKFKDK
jgi:quercetin dioxygenase-like cupin family protein